MSWMKNMTMQIMFQKKFCLIVNSNLQTPDLKGIALAQS